MVDGGACEDGLKITLVGVRDRGGFWEGAVEGTIGRDGDPVVPEGRSERG